MGLGRVWQTTVTALAVLVAAACVYDFVAAAVTLVREPHVLNYTEGISLLSARRVLDGLPLYPDVTQPPFVYLAYPPVYPLLSAVAIAVGGTQLAPLRLLTVLAELGTVLMVVRLLRFQGVARAQAWFAAALLAGLLATHKFHALARLDHLLLLAELVMVDATVRSLAEPRRGRLLLVAVMVPLTLFIKPTAIITLAVLGGWTLRRALRREPSGERVLLAFLAGAVAAGVIALALQWHTGGWFARHTLSYQLASGGRAPLPFTASQLGMLLSSRWPLLLALLVAAVHLRARLFVLLLVAHLGWLLVASGKQGADANYQIASLVLLVLVAGLGLAAMPLARRGLMLGALALTALLTAARLAPAELGHGALVALAPALEDGPHKLRQRLVDAVRDAPPGPVLCEEPYFAVINGRDYVMSDPFHLLLLAREGLIDLAPIRAASGRVTTAVVGPRLASSPLLHALPELRVVTSGYALDERDHLVLYQR